LREGYADGPSEVDGLIEEQDGSGCLLDGVEEDEAEDSPPGHLEVGGDVGVHHGPDALEERHQFVPLDLIGRGHTSGGRFMMQTLGVSSLADCGSGGSLVVFRLGAWFILI
jgi:hypothetical protein